MRDKERTLEYFADNPDFMILPIARNLSGCHFFADLIAVNYQGQTIAVLLSDRLPSADDVDMWEASGNLIERWQWVEQPRRKHNKFILERSKYARE